MIQIRDITEGEASVCAVGGEEPCSCPGCQETRSNVQKDNARQITRQRHKSTLWKKSRAALMFMIACVTSPCCTPLIVPLGLALLAGTPAAIWLGHNLGLVYGGLTLISIITAVIGWRWSRLGHPRTRNQGYPQKQLSSPSESKPYQEIS